MESIVYQNKETLYITTSSKRLCLNKKLISYISHNKEGEVCTVLISISGVVFQFNNNKSSEDYIPTEYLLQISM